MNFIQLIHKPLFIIISVWTALWVIMAMLFIIDIPRQIADDKIFIREWLQPRIDFVHNFVDENGKLPSQNEYIDFMLRTEPYNEIDPNDNDGGERFYASNVDSWRAHGSPEFLTETDQINQNGELNTLGITAIPQDGWIIQVWRGDWSEFYTSWDDRYYTNNYTWKWGIQQSVYCLLLGITPIFIYLLIQKIRTKRKHIKSSYIIA